MVKPVYPLQLRCGGYFEATIIQQTAGSVQPPKRRKYVHINTRLEQLKLRLQANELSVMEYADAAAYLLHLN